MRFKILIAVLFIFLFLPVQAFADNSFITIVNPVRISTYTKDIALNLRTQYDELSKRDLPATWLLTYEVIEKNDAIDEIKKFNKQQEIGLFLEITPQISKAAGVTYNQTNAWHRATSLFLSGYKVEDRKKLIDKYFSSFKEKFGYYPKSVGSWWTDSYSLSYMKSKYGITGTLGVSDQYDLDGYQVWGTVWSVPYYPSKINAAMPARTLSDKINVVTFRWAARDPINGYISPSAKQASLYSTQDYRMFGLSSDYYNYLVDTFSQQNEFNRYGQITLGLEADYTPETYSSQYAESLDIIKNQEEIGKTITNMSDFSNWYINEFKNISPQQVIESEDYLGTGKKVYWINNNMYRFGLVDNGKEARVIDFRTYPENYIEPFYDVPNKQYNLSINLPYVIDSQIDRRSSWVITDDSIQSVASSSGNLLIKFNKGSLLFTPSSIKVTDIKIPQSIISNPYVSVETSESSKTISSNKNDSVDENGVLYNEYSFRLPFTIARRIEPFKIFVYTVLVTLIIAASVLLIIRLGKKGAVVVCSILGLCIMFLVVRGQEKYYISQTEMDALSVLARFQKGKVLVYEKDCLKCSFSTIRPAAAAGRKGYVEKYSKQKTILDLNFQLSSSSKIAAKTLKDRKVRYIYLSKYEDYIETLPYLPQDIGLKRIYENANAQIWEVL